ncbi:MAG: ComEC/Rec2 family competence protein [Patescibacteria group bacterium]
MKISNIFLVICLIFIVVVFLGSPGLIEKNNPHLSEKDGGVFVGKVVKEPEIKSNNTKLIIKTEEGKVLVTTENYPEYFYGDVLKIKGKLKTPAVFEEFNYKNYLAKEDIYSVMYYPQIEILERNKGFFIYSAILKFKNKITEKIEKIMPFPEISLLEGIILGNKQIYSEEIKNELSITGTSHIVAISGMNIVIISEILMFVLIGLGMWRKQAFWFVLVLIFLFIIMVGAPASAIRAGIMGALLLYAQKIGRLSNATRIMIFAGAIMLIFNPLLLRYDVGFQLSFLAVFGLIYIKPILDEWLEKLRKIEEIGWLLEIITTTLAAQIAVLGVLIYNFGRISFISPIANILIVPTIYFLTILGFIFIGSAVIWSFLAKIILWPVYLGFTYVIRAIDLLSKIPWSAKEIKNVHWLFLIGYYILIIGFIWLYKRNKKLVY